MNGRKKASKKAAPESQSEAAEKPVLSLFVAGPSPRSGRAQRNLAAGVEALSLAPHNYTLVTIDVFAEPLVALKRGIMATPTLLLDCPAGTSRLIGDLSDRDALMSFLRSAFSR